jgi:hypothetical protein
MAAVKTYLQSAGNTANLTTYTFASQNLGTASSDRYIIVTAAGSAISGTNSISTLEVAGIPASFVNRQNQDSPNEANVAEIWIAAVPTGTSGNVVVTFSGGQARAAITMYSATGLNSATPYDTGNATDSGANPNPSTTIDCQADGFVIAATMINNAATTTGCAWTGLTENAEQVIEANAYLSSASDNFATAQTGLTVTSAWSNSNSLADACLAIASWSGTSGGTVTNPDFLLNFM